MAGVSRREAVALAGLLLVTLVVRLWSIDHGLPNVHNLDEYAHFVPGAAAMSRGTLNPHYFQNPPAFTYVLLALFSVIYALPGVSGSAAAALNNDPTSVFLLARIATAVLGVVGVGLLYVAVRRLYGVAAAWLAALFLGLAFLPVFYSHLALNDVPTLVPVALALVGVAGITSVGRRRDFLVAGIGLGAATATKYTAAAVALAIGVAWLIRWRDEPAQRRALWRHGALALVAAAITFVVLNPYSVLDAGAFVGGVRRQQQLTADVGKVGLDDTTGWQYYAWTLLWGFGVVPIGLALVGAATALRDNWRRVAPWLAFAVGMWLVIGAQTRFYARWFLPAYPVLALCAALGVVAIRDWLPARGRVIGVAVVAALALAQPAFDVVHSDVILGRTDTRAQAMTWLVRHVPAHTKVVAELVSSPAYFNVGSRRDGAPRYDLFALPRGSSVEKYASTLRASTVDDYIAQGYCIVMTGSTQRDRAIKGRVPGAIAYYRALAARAERLVTFSPVANGASLPRFNFDLSYNWYPRAYVRPGPRIDIYRLPGPTCPAN